MCLRFAPKGQAAVLGQFTSETVRHQAYAHTQTHCATQRTTANSGKTRQLDQGSQGAAPSVSWRRTRHTSSVASCCAVPVAPLCRTSCTLARTSHSVVTLLRTSRTLAPHQSYRCPALPCVPLCRATIIDHLSVFAKAPT